MFRTISCAGTLSVDIRIKNATSQSSNQSHFPSFATGEKIDGTVSIMSQNNLSFENLHICFIGEQSTNIPRNKPDEAHRQFLKLTQPIDESALPSPKTLKKGKRYEVPFAFEVADYLHPSSCRHSENPLVKAAHLHPPPSCGDATVAGFAGKLRDDFAPSACKVVYYILFKLERPSVTSGAQETIMEKILKVRIKPAVGEVPLPDLHMDTMGDEYKLYQEEVILDNSKSGSLAGRLALSLEQPGCFFLPLQNPVGWVSKAIRLTMVYISSDSNQASTKPELKSLRALITATTMYTTDIADKHPIAKKKDFFNRPLNYREVEVPLSIPSVPKLHWIQDETGRSYTTTLLVPVTLPKEHTFISTFHSCLISRVYSLSVQISVQSASSMFRLRAPMQIAAERDPAALPSYNASLGIIDVE